MFRTAYSRATSKLCNTPSGVRMASRKMKIQDDSGDFVLIDTEFYDLQDEINSFKDQCLIENIVKRYMMGDSSVLNVSPGVFIDTTNLPSDIHSVDDLLSRARYLYKTIPSDLNVGSFDSFVQSISTDSGMKEFYSKLYDYHKKKEEGVNNEKE